MRTLYVVTHPEVTHPEATHHVDGFVGGWFDSELSSRGREQAGLIADRLVRLVPPGESVEVYTSDLRRTLQTAEPIALRFGVPAVEMPDLREKSYGGAGGRPQSWLDERFVPPTPVGERMHHDEGIEGAETKGELAARVYRALDAILASDCQQQVIVTHGFALTFVVAAWIKMPLADAGYAHFAGSSGSISVLADDDCLHNRTVVRLNDTSHLRRGLLRRGR